MKVISNKKSIEIGLSYMPIKIVLINIFLPKYFEMQSTFV